MGQVGEACVAPVGADDLHLMEDMHAVIQPGSEGPARGLPANALLLSSLRRTAPLIFLNVSLGDSATLDRRQCGCPMETHGWTRHLSDVRSFEKLTSAGMTFLDVDVIRILDETLPAASGACPASTSSSRRSAPTGGPACGSSSTRPSAPLDPAAVREAFLVALASGSESDRSMAATWREAGLVDVERRPPMTETIGKILHLRTSGRR